jgi:hypothetical protein
MTLNQEEIRSIFGDEILTRGNEFSFSYNINEAVKPLWDSLENWRVKWHVTTTTEGTIVCFDPGFSSLGIYSSTHVKQNITCTTTPDPYPQSFLESFSSSIAITSWGECILIYVTTPCSISWGLNNHSSDTVTLQEAYLWNNEDGTELSHVTGADITELWGSGEIDPGGGFFISTSGAINVSTAQGAYTEWIFLDNQGRQFKCTLNGTLGTCVEN